MNFLITVSADIAVQMPEVPLPVSNVQQPLVYICSVCSSRLVGSHVQDLVVVFTMLITVSVV